MCWGFEQKYRIAAQNSESRGVEISCKKAVCKLEELSFLNTYRISQVKRIQYWGTNFVR